MNIRQGPSGPGLKPDDVNNDDMEDQDDDPMNGKEEKTSGMDLGSLERDLLKYQLSEDDDSGEDDGPLVLMTPSSSMSPTEEAPAVSLQRIQSIWYWTLERETHKSNS